MTLTNIAFAAGLAILGMSGTTAAFYFGGAFGGGRRIIKVEFHFLSKDSDYQSKIKKDDGEYFGKYGQTYADYLLSVTSNKNEAAWLWIQKEKYSSDQATGEFQNKKSWQEIRETCRKAYKGTKSTTPGEVTFTPEGGTAITFKEDDIWKYCSPFTKLPSTIKSNKDTYDQGKNGAEVSEQEKLASTKDITNNSFWIRKQEIFLEGTVEESHVFFQALKKETNRKPLSLKEKCEKAYQADKLDSSGQSTDTQPLLAEVVKYCSLSGQEAA